jgi:DeoD family purine-nucleoside phosphorylase
MLGVMSRETVHLRPNADVAERVLLPGDPGRALRLAQLLTDKPRMFNHNRGLWGYTGTAADGALLTVQATGMGGPSAAIVCEELIRLGARRLVRVGTCGALDPRLQLGDIVIAETARACDGASRALGASGPLAADPGLLAALRVAAPGARAGTVISSDLFYDPDPVPADGALAIEMEAAAIFAVAARHGVPAACVLAVSDLVATGERIRAAELTAAEAALGRAGAAAVGAAPEPLAAAD